jgi:Protein of unknown function (DUF2442)
VENFLRFSVSLYKTENYSWRNGMSTLALNVEPLAEDVICTDDTLRVILADGREIAVPLVWFPRLQDATPDQRKDWRLIGQGIGIHWESVDEDISVESLLAIR